MRTIQLSSALSFSLALLSACSSGEAPEVSSSAPVLKSGWILGPSGPLHVTYEAIGDLKVFEGDILLGEVHDEAPDPRLRSAFLNSRDWPNAIVPYEIDGALDAVRVQRILDAVAEWNANTPFRVIARTNEADFVRFIDGEQCRSAVGRQGGVQNILMDEDCGTTAMIHELGHAVGFFHEQSRQDRDDFIDIDFDNVRDEREFNFAKYDATTGTDFGPYDHRSVMHYGSFFTDEAFVFDTAKPTITLKDGSTFVRSAALSAGDRAAAWRKAQVPDGVKDRWLDNTWIGWPLDRTLLTADGRGGYLPTQGGRIYWHPDVGGTQLVYGDIALLYGQLGGDAGFLGVPVTDELGAPDGVGRYNHFAGGTIYWTPDLGAHAVYGPTRDKWAELSWERGPLGYPVGSTTATPDGIGRYSHFQNGSIYYTAATGAHEITGAIQDLYGQSGWERSCLGYPTSGPVSQYDASGFWWGEVQQFQNGTMTFYTTTQSAVRDCKTPILIIKQPKWCELAGTC